VQTSIFTDYIMETHIHVVYVVYVMYGCMWRM